MATALEKRISLAGIEQANYSGQSFRKAAAQYAADYGMLDEMIKNLGWWTSHAS